MPPRDEELQGKAEGRGIQSVEIGARLLAALCRAPSPMMLKDLAAEAGIVPAQAHPYLVSFRQLGLVDQAPNSGRYRLGPFAQALGITRTRTSDPFDVAREFVKDLSSEAEQTAILAVWGAFGPTIVQIVDGPAQIHMTSRVGTVYSLSGTATGLIFAAYLPEAQVKTVLALEKRKSEEVLRVGRPQPLSKAELRDVRAQGYATPKTPVIPGVWAVAAPVFDSSGELAFAVTLVGRDRNAADAPSLEVRDLLLARTAELSAKFGYISTDEPPA